MNQITKIKKLEPLVEEILINNSDCKDDDTMLILKVWAYQNPNLRNTTFSFVEFSRGLLNGFYASADSITRCRRKLQEKNPTLRGKTWVKRQRLEKEFRAEIKSV